MEETFDGYSFFMHLARRWRVPAAACAVAGGLALIISLLVPAKYTATARILIEPPGSSDPRAATAVSPVYLESLRTYEHFALSDSLFARVVDELEIRDKTSPEPLSSLKKRVLEVNIPSTTKIMEIAVTLSDPAKAQQLAAFVAKETVRLSQRTNMESDRVQTDAIETMRSTAQERVQQAETESMRAAEKGPPEGLIEELEALVKARSLVQRQRLMVRDLESRQQADFPADATESRNQRLAGTKQRLARLDEEITDLNRQIDHTRLTLGTRSARRDQIDAEREAAWSALEDTESRLTRARSATASRGERLQVIDPGVVPEKPSSPNIPLNVIIALAFAMLASLLYVTLEFSFQLRRAEARRESLRVPTHG
jgi:uncharacterized protein involved in exopolysaccharide biosynthesis